MRRMTWREREVSARPYCSDTLNTRPDLDVEVMHHVIHARHHDVLGRAHEAARLRLQLDHQPEKQSLIPDPTSS